jgi:hypothetical protein
MTTSTVEIEIPAVLAVSVTDDTLSVDLADGRTVAAPLAWFPRLLHGSPDQRNKWRLIGNGMGIHWEDLDEDVSVEGLLAGHPSGESQASLGRWLAARGERVPDA